jgi:hypothetical protein
MRKLCTVGQRIVFQSSNKLVELPRELWHEIALYVPQRDLKSCLFVPGILSMVARQALFRKTHLQFETASADDGDDDDFDNVVANINGWHAIRSADILGRIISDMSFASRIKHLSVSVPRYAEFSPFQLGDSITNSV